MSTPATWRRQARSPTTWAGRSTCSSPRRARPSSRERTGRLPQRVGIRRSIRCSKQSWMPGRPGAARWRTARPRWWTRSRLPEAGHLERCRATTTSPAWCRGCSATRTPGMAGWVLRRSFRWCPCCCSCSSAARSGMPRRWRSPSAPCWRWRHPRCAIRWMAASFATPPGRTGLSRTTSGCCMTTPRCSPHTRGWLSSRRAPGSAPRRRAAASRASCSTPCACRAGRSPPHRTVRAPSTAHGSRASTTRSMLPGGRPSRRLPSMRRCSADGMASRSTRWRPRDRCWGIRTGWMPPRPQPTTCSPSICVGRPLRDPAARSSPKCRSRRRSSEPPLMAGPLPQGRHSRTTGCSREHSCIWDS